MRPTHFKGELRPKDETMNDFFQLQSDGVNEIAASLAKAQSQIEHALKDSKNPHFKSSFASLASVINATRDGLTANGISVAQQTVPRDGQLFVVTTLFHASGQWIRSFTPVIFTKQDAQGMGSGMTYARRYALAAMVGISQEDDDGNEASKPRQAASQPREIARITGTKQAGEYRIDFGTVEKGYKGLTIAEAVERDGLPRVQKYISGIIDSCLRDRKEVAPSYAEMRDRLAEYVNGGQQ
jgi:hypothetical protein